MDVRHKTFSRISYFPPMENAHSAPRFDWIAWLATIPGVPSDWGSKAPATEPDLVFSDAPEEPTPFPLAA